MNKVSFHEQRALVRLISKANVNHLEFFSHLDFQRAENLMTKLFYLLKDDKISDIKEIELNLYKHSQHSNLNFNRLYYRFQNKLLNTLFFIDTNSPLFIDRAKAYFHCSKRLCAIKILVDKGMWNLCISICEKTLPICHKYEFTEMCMQFTKMLLQQYSTTLIHKRKFIEYRKKFSFYSKLFENDLLLSQVASDIGYYLNSSDRKYFIDFKSKEFQLALETAISCTIDESTSEMILKASKITSFYYEKSKNYELYDKFNKIFLNKLIVKNVISIVSIENIVINQLKINFIFKDLVAAQNLKKEYFNKINVGNFNWYICYYYFILTLFHAKSYFEGVSLVYFLINHPTFKSNAPIIKENIFVLDAYSQLLIKIGKVKNSKLEYEFKLSKFINQVPIYSKDKHGVNISIIMIQILSLMAQKKYNKLIDRIESLNLYSYRYLKKDETFRSQCFIRMISEIIKAGFKKQGSQARAKKWYDKLVAVPIHHYPESADIEIIPYEDLWEMVLELLD